MATAQTVMNIDELSLAQKIGQLVMIDFDGTTVPDWLSHSFAKHHWGGVILFARNARNREQVAALCRDLQACSGSPLPLFIGIDQEGGIVDRLPFDELASSPGAMALAATGETRRAHDIALVNGQELRSLGINLNFAPCVDVNNNPLNPIIGVRSYGETADQVSRFAFEVARGYREAGIIACAKHFPGHGDTSVDSHLALPSVTHDRERLDAVELAPYRDLIQDGLEMIMTAHIVYPLIDPSGHPATLSRLFLTDILRGELGFGGVVITDSLSMKAIIDNHGAGKAAVMAVQAGADILLTCGPREMGEEMARALLLEVERGGIRERSIDISIARIFALKAALSHACPLESPPPDASTLIRSAARASITVVRNSGTLPLCGNQRVLLVTPSTPAVSSLGETSAPLPLAKALRERGLQVSEHEIPPVNDDDSGAAIATCRDAARGVDAIVLCLCAQSRLSDRERMLTSALTQADAPLTVVSLNSPYVLMDVPEVGTYVCTYGYSESSILALADVLTGLVTPRGKLPVSILPFHRRGAGVGYHDVEVPVPQD